MAHYKLTKETLDILKNVRISHSTTGTSVSINISYIIKQVNASGKVANHNNMVSLNVDTNPTSNCQLASLRGFYSNLAQFQPRHFYFTPLPAKPTKAQLNAKKIQDLQKKLEKYNLKVRRLALLKGFAYLNNAVTSKKQFFIDIPRNHTKNYHFFSPWACKRRIPQREVDYISTNGSSMMYTLMVIEPKKLQKYL